MIIIGLTGSIGMGKSTAAGVFRDHGVAVFDADAGVHRLYEGPAVAAIEAAIPGVTRDGKVDRVRLSARLGNEPGLFARLEAIVHPLVQAEEQAFIEGEMRRRARFAVLEIPLLFETGAEERVDVIVVVSAPEDVQCARVLEREGMTRDKFEMIRARQMPDVKKRERADFVVDTSGPLEQSAGEIAKILESLEGRVGEAYDRYWSPAG